MSRISHGFSDIISRFVECNHALSLGVISARLQLQKRYTMAIMWLCMCEIDQFFNLLANQWFIQLLWCFSCWWIYVFSASTLTFYLLFSLVCLRFRHFFLNICFVLVLLKILGSGWRLLEISSCRPVEDFSINWIARTHTNHKLDPVDPQRALFPVMHHPAYFDQCVLICANIGVVGIMATLWLNANAPSTRILANKKCLRRHTRQQKRSTMARAFCVGEPFLPTARWLVWGDAPVGAFHLGSVCDLDRASVCVRVLCFSLNCIG